MKKYLLLILLIFLLVAIFITDYGVKKSKELRQKAAPLTTILFQPSSLNVLPTTNFSLNANISAGTNLITGVELNIIFDPLYVKINTISLPTVPFIPDIVAGSLQIDNTLGTARLIMLSSPATPKSGNGTLVVLNLTPLKSGSTQVRYNTVTTQASAINEQGNVIISYQLAQINIIGPSPTATPRPSPTATPRPSVSPTATPRPSVSPTATPRPSVSPTATPRPSVSPTATPRPSVSPTATPRPSVSPTATPRPTPSVTPTPVATPMLASLVTNIRFEGVNSQKENKTIKITLEQSDVVKYSYNIVMTANLAGIYANETNPVIGLTPGSYDVFVKGPAHLTRKFSNQTLSAGINTLIFTDDAQLLLAGDGIVDDVSNVYDYGNLLDNYRCGSVPPPVNKNCTSMASDYNFNGEIDIHDYNYMIGNFEMVGDN